MHIAIIDYGSGNLRSAAKAFERAAAEKGIKAQISVTSQPERVAKSDRIVLPGVGAFADCRKGLEDISGMLEALDEAVIQKQRPFLGICVGMQLMASIGREHGSTPGFNWISGEVVKITPDDAALKVPHMGWNTLDVINDHPLFRGTHTGADGLHAYFVHSYHFVPENDADLCARTYYGGPVTACVARDNMAGVQFHPEKSQKLGLELIGNFLQWTP